MQLIKYFITLSLLVFFAGCSVSPQAINYGSDGCHYCKMTIVDKVHAAEIVTRKGKVYKFDSSECMINFTKEFDSSEVALYLVNNFTEPEKLTDATKSTYLISQNIPSPMGAFLTAFKNEGEAIKIKSEKGGNIYSWQELLKHFK